MPPFARLLQPFRRRFPREAGPALACLLAAAACILALTWPWCLHFDGSFLNHWDPPFHAWKLEVMARRILSGDLLFRNTDTPLFYPYSGTLYYEALTWPAALAAAALTAWTSWSPAFIYHVVLIAGWSLAAPCMQHFLRGLGLSRTAAFAGGVLFCILPYRMSYANEFQMQLVFALPLFYGLLARLLARPSARGGIGLALCWWLFAVTELNQAVFVLFTLPFIVLAHLAGDPGLLGRRRFWTAAAAGAATGLLSLPVLLLPYLQQKAAGAVERPLREVIRHSIQPLSYAVPFGRFSFWRLDAKVEELWGYPTLGIVVLALAALGFWLRELARDPDRPARRHVLTLLPLAASLGLFGIATVVLHLHADQPPPGLPRLWRALPLVCTACGALFCLTRAPGRSRRLLTGLAAAAVFCLFLSFGPTLDLRMPPRLSVPNSVYMPLYNHTPILSGFRAACRFGVFVQFFLVCAAACGLHRLLQLAAPRRRGWRGAAARAGLAALALGAVAFESIPPRPFLTFRAVDRIDQAPVARRLARRREPAVLAAFPMGNRMDDGMLMFGLLKDRHLSVYGWAGFFPAFSQRVMKQAERGDAAAVAALLAQLWPDCLLWIDRSRRVEAKPSFVAAHPPYYVTPGAAGDTVDYTGMFSDFAREIDRDERFSLMQLKPPPPDIQAAKLLRSDQVRRLPVARARFRAAQSGRLDATFNGRPLPSAMLVAGEAVTWSAGLEAQRLERASYNRLAFTSAVPFAVEAFQLATAPGGEAPPP